MSETSALVRETLASPTVTDTILAAKLTLKCEELERERNVWKRESDILRAELTSEHEKALDWFIAYQDLKNAVTETLADLSHLADGDQCTLKKLKDAHAKAP